MEAAMRLRWDWIAGGGISAALLGAIIVNDDMTTRKRIADTKAAEWAAKVEAARMPIYYKPWDKYIECGIWQRDLRECDKRFWPGQVYPDEPIPGEKTPGIVWSCHMMRNPDPRLPARKVCYADASPERKRAYPCPIDTVGHHQPTDRFCKAAVTGAR
jgi:hypothetical protein